MQTLFLSDHTGERLAEARGRRERAFQEADAAWRKALIEHRWQRLARRKEVVDALRGLRPLRFLSAGLRYVNACRVPEPQQPVLQQADDKERVWATGRAGEKRVAERLSQHLSDAWTLICGYRNGAGEIDQVLVGPQGVIAIEIKTVNGVVHCDGDRWWRDKYDRWGNCVESGEPLQDARGRAPSRQINQAAAQLETAIRRQSTSLAVARAVLLAHDRSRLGQMRNLTVDYVACLNALDVRALVQLGNMQLTAEAVARTVQAIVRNHDAHAQPRPSRLRTGGKLVSAARTAMTR